MLLDLVCEKDIAQNRLDGYFYVTEKVGSNSLSVFLLSDMFICAAWSKVCGLIIHYRGI